jgi:GAF domain-containing protein
MLARWCVELLGVSAAAVTVFDEHGEVHAAAASCVSAHLLSLFAVQAGEGPGIDCARTGHAVASPRLVLEQQRWPRFIAAAEESGYRAVHTLPMRRRQQVIGMLTLLDTEPGPVADTDLRLGQSLSSAAHSSGPTCSPGNYRPR